jgi:DNA polymerase-3 subunit beta
MTALSIERAPLLAALSHVGALVPVRNTIPILANLLLEWGDDTLSITGRNGDAMMVAEVPARPEGAGATTLNAAFLIDVVKRGEDGAQVRITLGVEGGRATVSIGRARYQLATLSPLDYAGRWSVAGGVRFTLPAADLARGIAKTQHAQSTEETKYWLNGIYMHHHEGELRFATTDGKARLAVHAMPAPAGAEAMPGIILPSTALRSITNLAQATDGDVTIDVAQALLSVTAHRMVYVTKLVEGTFPDYEQIVPRKATPRIEIDGTLLRDSVDRVLIAAEADSNKARMIVMDAADGTLTIKAGLRDTQADCQAPCNMLGEAGDAAWHTAFNGRYLVDVVGAAGSGNLLIYQDDVRSPALIVTPGDPATTHVIMPMRG